MWEFAKSSPLTTIILVWILAWAATRPFWYAWMAYNRTLRSRNIIAQGWPPAPIDADGDVIYPSKDDD